MIRLPRAVLPFLVAALPVAAQETPSPAAGTSPPPKQARPFIQITPQDSTPTVRAIAPIDESNIFFLNQRGQVGVAKFSPGLSLIGWEFYSEVKLDALPFVAVGPNYSVVTASPFEVTQSFDTDGDVELDFFQALVRDWPGRDEGVSVTAGPVPDPHGRLLFALSPWSPPAEEGEEKKPARARLVAWQPGAGELLTVTESQLRIDDFAVTPDGLLAARLFMPGYKDGFYISLTELPPPARDGEAPAPVPSTRPSLLVPAELTGGRAPEDLVFFEEDGTRKLLLFCPDSRQLIEIVPEHAGDAWQGAILLRAITESPVNCAAVMPNGAILGGSATGFVPVDPDEEAYRIERVGLTRDGIELVFTQAVDRFSAVKPENFSVRSVSLKGGESGLTVHPVIEADGFTVILKTPKLASGTVLRIVCKNVPSETGEALLGSAVFYTVHVR